MANLNQLANRNYGDDFENLSAGQKAAVKRMFNAQDSGCCATPKVKKAKATTPVTNVVTAKLGRVGVNGMKECALRQGQTISDLLAQAGVSLDTQKEKVNAQSTGLPVSLSDPIENGETYIITTEIKSA
jgi:hypothetical protein